MRIQQAVTAVALGALALAVLLLMASITGQPGQAASSVQASPTNLEAAAGSYVLLGWNDLGMHCYNNSFASIAILPPYNTLWTQVVLVGNPPQIITSGITVEYSFPQNTYSAGKTDFWDYAESLFSVHLAPNVGLTGKTLSGTMDIEGNHFIATGIPLTEYTDQDLVNRDPYQLALIIVRNASTGAELARNRVVAPVSTEMTCVDCHADDGDATTTYPITPTGKVETNILAVHDYLSMAQYPAGHTGPLLDPVRQPVLCAECHSSNALGAAGLPGLSSLSNAMHRRHAPLDDITPDVNGCYKCHPGPQTRCLRDVMSQDEGMQCQDCHGDMAKVAQNADPWLNEPRCDNSACHGSSYRLTNALYRFSQGHGGLYCEACHDSTHAIAPSREPTDGIKFVNLQGNTETLRTCTVCHTSQPAGEFRHAFVPRTATRQIFFPAVESGMD